jgi:hypothetical protein
MSKDSLEAAPYYSKSYDGPPSSPSSSHSTVRAGSYSVVSTVPCYSFGFRGFYPEYTNQALSKRPVSRQAEW